MLCIDFVEVVAHATQAGMLIYPEMWSSDTVVDALNTYGVPVMFVLPPSGGSYSVQIRYYRQMPVIGTPETSAVVPWFPNQSYLITRLAGELMKIGSDSRTDDFLGNGPNGAQGILQRFLKNQTDDEGRAKTVKLDRRLFGKSFNRLPQTKTLGW